MTVVSRVLVCKCFCHLRAHDTAWKYGVDSRDHVACILACDKCRRNHEAVLYDDEPPSRPLPEWIDPPRPADACGDDGEGRE
jgi:hypothetical protein